MCLRYGTMHATIMHEYAIIINYINRTPAGQLFYSLCFLRTWKLEEFTGVFSPLLLLSSQGQHSISKLDIPKEIDITQDRIVASSGKAANTENENRNEKKWDPADSSARHRNFVLGCIQC